MENELEKVCIECKQKKPIGYFQKTYAGGAICTWNVCIDCRRGYMVKKKEKSADK